MLALCIEKKKNSAKILLSLCEESKFIAVATYDFTSANVVNELRMGCFALGAKIKVIKNNIACIALSGTKYECLTLGLSGSTLFILSSCNVQKVLEIVKSFVEFKFFFFENKIFDSKFTNFFLTLPEMMVLYLRFLYVLTILFRVLLCVLLEVYIKFVRNLHFIKSFKLMEMIEV